MDALGVAQVSYSKTQRRRVFWAVWWSGAPAIKPFRKPDASSGGARTLEEAAAEAERAAGRPLMTIEPKWAKAWMRVLRGEPAWPDIDKAREGGKVSTPQRDEGRLSVWAVLGIEPHAPAEVIRRAYKKRALETHPDRGGDDERFRAVQRAYERALEKSAKTARKKGPSKTRA